MTNLWKETQTALRYHGKQWQDVVWVGCKKFEISKELFEKLADCEYDAGFGGVIIADDLLVVGDSWWLERQSYDGSEWWEYKELAKRPTEIREIERLKVEAGYYSDSTLEELNQSREDE